jgi:hypothetical protein
MRGKIWKLKQRRVPLNLRIEAIGIEQVLLARQTVHACEHSALH